MKRRSLISVVGGVTLAAAGIPGALAQQPRRIPLVVDLGVNPLIPGEKEQALDWLVKGLRDRGYVEGRDFVFEYRHANGKPEQLTALIESQVREKVDVICSATPDVLRAAMRITRSVPIVFVGIGDPVGAGFVDSLAKPGRNLTGLAWHASPEVGAKQFQLLRKVSPGSRPLALLWNPEWETSPESVRAIQLAAKTLGVVLASIEVHSPADIEPAFDRMSRAGVQAVHVLGSGFAWIHRERLAALAA